MTNPVSVSKLQAKSHAAPDETRTPDKTKVEVVRLEGFTVGRLNLEPGWRWSECIKPIVGTDSCQLSHVGYLVSGQMGIKLNDGTEQIIGAGASYTIPPGHDGWVVGDQPVIAIEVMSADQFGRPS